MPMPMPVPPAGFTTTSGTLGGFGARHATRVILPARSLAQSLARHLASTIFGGQPEGPSRCAGAGMLAGMTSVLCVPQWQGSSSPIASRLVEGARRTAALVPADARVTVPVLDAAGERAAGVRALDVLLENLRLVSEAMVSIDDVVVTAGGDCGVELAPVAAARARHGQRLTVLWIDAHPDVSTPETLPSGSFHGMVLRTLLGQGPAALTPSQPLAPDQVVLAGIRSFEAGQREYLAKARIRWYGVDEIEGAFDGLAGPIYVHLDLDVLDPAEFSATCYPEPDGVQLRRLLRLLSNIDEIIGASITEHAPDEDVDRAGDADVIRQLGAALCR
jgi:arginase